MKYWIVSPNVTNDKSEEDLWKNAIIKFNVAVIGWGENDDLGRVFIDKVRLGDIILIAQGANWQKKLFLAGQVSTAVLNQHLPGTPRPALHRKLSGILNAHELALLNLNFEGAAYGDASRIPAIYELKPWQNEFDKAIAHKLMEKINEAKSNEEKQNLIELLKYKKQIILQGPPGTGKTKLAKELAADLIGNNIVRNKKNEPSEISDQNIVDTLQRVNSIPLPATRGGGYKLVDIDTHEKVVLLKSNKTGPTRSSFEKIKEYYKEQSWRNSTKSNHTRRAFAIAKFIFDKIDGEVISDVNQSNQFKIIQFHPSYTYEDFVRGIVSKPNPDGDGIIYEAQNKIFALFANDALDNWTATKHPYTFSKEKWLQDTVEDFLEYLSKKIHLEPKTVRLTEKVYINKITKESIGYTSDTRTIDPGGSVPVSDLVKMFNENVTTRDNVKSLSSLAKRAQHLSSNWLKVLELFKKYISDNKLTPSKEVSSENQRNYVFIIDEINRANLSSVLGELIYALEYRGEAVESMYEVCGSNKLILPPNLYIIGTMNTADRSVGHIDYAIRRRFAFVDVLPKLLTDVPFESALFEQVSLLFVKNMDSLEPSNHLSAEFRPQDVRLGHSYFIKEKGVESKIRLEYEIIPILEEYIKDGVLKDSSDLRKAIDNLQTVI